MVVYISMFISSVFFALIAEKSRNKRTKMIFQILVALPFIIVSAVRYNVGTDYSFRYVPNYLEFVNSRTVASLEPLFILIIKMCIFFTYNPTALFVITSILINGLMFYTIFKYSKSPILSIIIYFFGSFYFTSMNILRQFLAMVILFSGYHILFSSKNKYVYILMVIIASLLHTMSIVFLVVLFFDRKPIKLKNFLFIIVIVAFAGRYLGDIVNYIINNTALQNNMNIYKYVKYFVRDGKLYLSTVVTETFIYLFIYESYISLKKRGESIEKEATFFLNMQSIVLLTMILTFYYSLFFRVTLLFSIFQILSVPYFWSKFRSKKSRLIRLQTKSTIYTIVILGLLFTKMIYSNIIQGAEEILPYQTIFEKDTVEMENIK